MTDKEIRLAILELLAGSEWTHNSHSLKQQAETLYKWVIGE